MKVKNEHILWRPCIRFFKGRLHSRFSYCRFSAFQNFLPRITADVATCYGSGVRAATAVPSYVPYKKRVAMGDQAIGEVTAIPVRASYS